MGKIETSDTYSLEEVKKLHLKMDCANLTIQETEKAGQITVAARYEEEGDYSARLKDGKLKVEYVLHTKRRIENTDCITVTIPAGAAFEKITLQLGAGNTEIHCAGAEFEKAELDIGAGNLNVKQFKIREKLEISVGAGNVNMDEATASAAKVRCGAGKCYLNGTVSGNLAVTCGVGSCEILLDAKAEDYSYEVKSGLGRVMLNGNKCGKTGTDYFMENPGSFGTIRMYCGVGSIDLTTQKRING